MNRQRSIVLVMFIGLSIVILSAQSVRAADSEISWLSNGTPTVNTTGSLPDNTVPFSASRDCVDGECFGAVSAGQYSSHQFNDGVNGWATIRGMFLFPGPSVTFITADLTRYGILHDITPSKVKFTKTYNIGNIYDIQAPWEMRFVDERTGKEMVNVGVSEAAFSNNGKWMVMHVTDPYSNNGSLAIFNTTTFVGKVIAPNSGNTYYWGNGGNNTPGVGTLAVSDDGRYVADSFTQQTPVTGNKEYGIRIYDTTTCTDQYGISETRANCTYKNIWTGKVNGVSKNSGGIAEQLSGNPERPLNVRFKNDTTITFSAIHDYVSYTNFKASTYEATISSKPEPIKLLAMGDSYISGEGAYAYRDGTDTPNNKCHQSTVSYLYLLGKTFASEYHSVACSGAVMNDVFTENEKAYPGQVKDKKTWYDRDQENILNTYAPGYAGQHLFVGKAKPNAIIISIGGNDIAFADIVKRCVLSFAWDPCYHKQSERKSLLLTIYSKFAALKTTYAKILSEAPKGTRLYVMGYPQVINPTGNCGVNVHFDDSEKQFASLLIERLNSTVKAAAESSGAVFVDVSSALVGHRLCDTHDDGVNGLTSGDDSLSVGFFLGSKKHSFGLGNESYHPTALGHRLISKTVAQETDNLTKEPQGVVNVLLPRIQDNDEFITTGAADDATSRRIEQQDVLDTNIVSAGEKVSLDINTANLKQGSLYQVVFHSEEVSVADGILPSSGNLHLDLSVPKLTPGIHSVDVYTKDASGEDVDITEDVYITASKDDFDGDGIKNDADAFPLINDTGKIIVEEPDVDTKTESGATSVVVNGAENISAPKNVNVITVLPQAILSSAPESTNLLGHNSATEPIFGVLGANDVVILPDGKNKNIASTVRSKKQEGKIAWYLTTILLLTAVITIGAHKRSKK